MTEATLSIALCAALAAAPALHAQAEFSIPAPASAVGEFSDVSGLVELRNGRVLIVDQREGAVSVVDFSRGAVSLVGRTGDGPREYRLPWRAFAMRGDSAAVFDRGNRRLLLIGPEGEPGGFATYPTSLGPSTVVPTLPEGPRAIDSLGRLYWAGTGFVTGPGAVPNTFADSSPILRFDPRTVAPDTVGWLRRPNATATGERGGRSAIVAEGFAYPAIDGWAVFGDGTVAIVRSPEFRIELRRPGMTPMVADIPTSRLSVNEFHKARWRVNQRRQIRVSYPVENGQLGRPRVLPAPASVREPRGWPDELPPFEPAEVLAGPNGAVWIGRPVNARGARKTYDVVDMRGQLVQRVSLPHGSYVVGFGSQTVYAVRSDDDDILTVWRFSLPPRPG